MHSLSVLTIIQLTLVGLGLIFQIIAMTALYRETPKERSDRKHDSWGENNVDLGQRARRPGRPISRDAVHDYYEMDRTPPGVRPADLRKTARVKYVDDVKVVPPPAP
jgi:hypothetical protein